MKILCILLIYDQMKCHLLTSNNGFIKLYLFHGNKMSSEENQFVNIIQLNEFNMHLYHTHNLENKSISKTIYYRYTLLIEGNQE